jgi:hypothetical protein
VDIQCRTSFFNVLASFSKSSRGFADIGGLEDELKPFVDLMMTITPIALDLNVFDGNS